MASTLIATLHLLTTQKLRDNVRKLFDYEVDSIMCAQESWSGWGEDRQELLDFLFRVYAHKDECPRDDLIGFITALMRLDERLPYPDGALFRPLIMRQTW